MAGERLSEVAYNAIILHQAREALKSGKVPVPFADLGPAPLLPIGLKMVANIEHAFHKKQVKLQKAGVVLEPNIFSKITA